MCVREKERVIILSVTIAVHVTLEYRKPNVPNVMLSSEYVYL